MVPLRLIQNPKRYTLVNPRCVFVSASGLGGSRLFLYTGLRCLMWTSPAVMKSRANLSSMGFRVQG